MGVVSREPKPFKHHVTMHAKKFRGKPNSFRFSHRHYGFLRLALMDFVGGHDGGGGMWSMYGMPSHLHIYTCCLHMLCVALYSIQNKLLSIDWVHGQRWDT